MKIIGCKFYKVFSLFILLTINFNSFSNLHFEKIDIEINNPPVAKNDTFILAVETSNTITSNILTNDYDPEGDDFILSFVFAPEIGEVDVDCEGEFTFICPKEFIGKISFTYIISETDNNLNFDEAEVIIHVINDYDNDGIADDIDVDDDNDGILDFDDGINVDTDNDGINNSFDIDSDSDGIPDNIESQPENNYILPIWNDTDGDGWDDAYDPDNNGIYNNLVDTDNDGTPDFLDTDSDDDNIEDIIEGSIVNKELKGVTPLENDSDNDGLDDAFDIVSGWGNVNNSIGSNVTLPDINKNGVRDWRDNPEKDFIPGDDNALQKNNFEFTIYPNPTAGEFYIDLPVSDIEQTIEFEIINLQGKTLFKHRLENTTTRINPGQLEQGYYFIKLKTNLYTSIKKLVISN